MLEISLNGDYLTLANTLTVQIKDGKVWISTDEGAIALLDPKSEFLFENNVTYKVKEVEQ